jgi:hypothetical protein
MDNEWFELKDWAMQTLRDYKEELIEEGRVRGKAPSALKKVDRLLGALGVDTAKTYADMLDDARRKGLTPAQLARKGRNMEETIMNAFRVLPDDPAHHMYSLRTAGDLIQKVPSTIREEGLKMLKDMGYELGNVRRNLISLAEYVHQGRTGKGAELATLGNVVVDKTKTKIAHPRGTGDPLISRTVDWRKIKTPQDFVDAYLPLLQQQAQDVAGALETSAPREQILSEAVEKGTGIKNIFSTGRTVEEVATGRKFLQTVPDVVRESYLTFKNGALGLGGLLPLPLLGRVSELIPAAGAVLDTGEAVAGAVETATAETPVERAAGAMKTAGGALGLSSLAFPPLGLPAVMMSSGSAALKFQTENARGPESIVPELFPEPQAVMARTPTGVATLTKPESEYERRKRARTGR